VAASRRSQRRSADPERVEILADADRPGGWMLLLERIRQSYVDVDDATYLDFEYIRWMAHVIDTMAAGPLAATHLGGGAGTLVRYLGATRPGSTQIVCEPDVALTELVRARLPFARTVKVRIRPVDGRAGLGQLGNDSADLIVLDAFAGGRVPADLTTTDCAGQIVRVLRPSGTFIANVGDGASMAYSRRVTAGLRAHLPHVALITDKAVLGGRRFGNVVLAAAATPLAIDDVRRSLAGEPFPCQLVTGAELERWLGSSIPFTDYDSARSPAPPEASWRVAPEDLE
jgi:hypothetical protein